MTDFKPRWIRWDEDAFRADRQVSRMTPRQRAMCRNLMIESYYNELRPYLPADDAQLWQLADADSPEDWRQNKASVIVKFKPVTGEDGEPLLSNKRVMEEWSTLQASLEQKRSAAAKSVAARCQRVRERENLPHSPSENQNQKEKEKENKSVERPLNERSTSVREGIPIPQCSAALEAAKAAYEHFQNDADFLEDEPLEMLLWILYRAAHPTNGGEPEIPQTLDYYLTSCESFKKQYDYEYGNVLAEAADRLEKHAMPVLIARNPGLARWLVDRAVDMGWRMEPEIGRAAAA